MEVVDVAPAMMMDNEDEVDCDRMFPPDTDALAASAAAVLDGVIVVTAVDGGS